MDRRVLVTGASGLLGRAILRQFQQDATWTAQGTALKRSAGGLWRVDITDLEAVMAVVHKFKPNVIVHSAADRSPCFTDQHAQTMRDVNVSGTSNMCQAAAAVGAGLIFISTDYVFDGRDPPYREDATPSPLNPYGRSKAEGETVVQAADKAHVILRVANLYGEVESLEESPITVLFKHVKDPATPASISHHELRCPTHCRDVADVVKALAERKVAGEETSGIFHWANDEKMTKYQMAVIMGEIFQLPTDHIQPDTESGKGALRPFDPFLDTTKLQALGIGNRIRYRDEIYNVLKDFYP